MISNRQALNIIGLFIECESVASVDDSIVFVIVLDLHVLVELFLGVEALIECFSVDLFDVVASDGSGTGGLPVLQIAGCPHACL